MTKFFNIKSCKNNLGYDNECLNELQKFNCAIIASYYDKKNCYQQFNNLKNFVSFLGEYPDFESQVLPELLSDMIYYCNASMIKGKTPILTFKNFENIDIRRLKNVNAIFKYPYINKYGSKTMHIITVKCDKVLQNNNHDKFDMENYEPKIFGYNIRILVNNE